MDEAELLAGVDDVGMSLTVVGILLHTKGDDGMLNIHNLGLMGLLKGHEDVPWAAKGEIIKAKCSRIAANMVLWVMKQPVCFVLGPFAQSEACKEATGEPAGTGCNKGIICGTGMQGVVNVCPHFGGKRLTPVGHVLPAFEFVEDSLDTGSEGWADLVRSADIRVRKAAQKLGDCEQVVVNGTGLDLFVGKAFAGGKVHSIESHLVVASFE
jgi:hypothetical protein